MVLLTAADNVGELRGGGAGIEAYILLLLTKCLRMEEVKEICANELPLP